MTTCVNVLGTNRLSAFKRIVRLAKSTTLLSGVSTILCAAAVFGFQLTSWLRTDVWETYPLSSAIRGLKSDESAVYVTASTDKFQTELTGTQAIVDWLLGIPTVLLLLVVAGLHVVFYLYLVAVEKQQDVGGQGWQADGARRGRFM
jgi:urea transporter